MVVAARPILERLSRTVRMRRGVAVAAAVASALVLVGCDGDSSDEGGSDQQASTPGATAAPMQPPTCAQTQVLRTGDIRGQAAGATLWALPMAPLPFDAGREVKIVWRMTGSGPPEFTVTDPGDGEDPDALQWGPEEHLSSSWHRPGDEWGTGFRFAGPGCWHITVRRGDAAGSIAVRVVDSA